MSLTKTNKQLYQYYKEQEYQKFAEENKLLKATQENIKQQQQQHVSKVRNTVKGTKKYTTKVKMKIKIKILSKTIKVIMLTAMIVMTELL